MIGGNMKLVYLILAILMLLCLAPMPYGYYMLVRFVAMVVFGVMAYRVGLLPQRFVSPPARTAHGCGIDCRIFGEQGFDVGNKGVRRIDGVKPVGDIAQVGVELIINNKPPLFQSFNLPSEGKGLLGIFHNEKTKSRPVALPERGRVPGSIGCKVTTLNRNFQMIWKKSA